MEHGTRDSSPSSSAGDAARAAPPPDADADAEASSQNEGQRAAAAATSGEPSGSHEMEPQPGPSGVATREQNSDSDILNTPGPSNSEVAQDNVSSAAASAAPGAGAGLCIRFPDEGSNSDDFWAASSSGGAISGASRSGSGENLFDESSQDSNDDDVVTGAGVELTSNIPSSAGPSGTGKENGVPLSSFSPQPSSSSSNGIAAGPALATAGTASGMAAASSSFPLLTDSLGTGVSSSPAVARSAPGFITSSGRSGGVNASGVPSIPQQNQQQLQRPSSPNPGPSGYAPPGEISNPPSPLGGGGGVGRGGGDRAGPPPRAGMKRDFRAADSAVAGPSGVGQSWKRANNRDDQQAVPGPSGLQHGTSEAAAVPRSRSPLSACQSPIRQPLTPADHFMISSSTGLVDSVPPTPDAMDGPAGDNDLSVPSPAEPRRLTAAAAAAATTGVGGSRGGGGSALAGSSRASAALASASGAAAASGAARGFNDEEMVDSTVDSSGIPMQRESSLIEVGEAGGFCQSSRYIDNSDDDDSDEGQVVSQRQVERNEEGISTSGQVDEGQFRLVPNDPEDDVFNSRNPPRRQPDPSPAPSREFNPVPGPSNQVRIRNCNTRLILSPAISAITVDRWTVSYRVARVVVD